ncbi:S8 family serine peptidase [Ornithinimicrobium avium]|uniref:Peptidase S8/S53 domain-containing protein n=1 Tax=Ornithinimicrobium avium TaxID=2283195 RepID=A0A345NK84_9MICO|nr:S8 family serine peptidase [Ornithinimicrobium avium]AXH95442.1 hypothetical protein DV701_04245 [Ornithinimicrobium avium]
MTDQSELLSPDGDGFAPGDPVRLLTSSLAPMMPRLHPSAGQWLVPAVAPLRAGGLDGSGITAVVVDTGVLPDHPSLRGRVDAMIDLTGTGREDRHGHGTVVAAILAAQAPGVRIISVKAVRDDGTADVSLLAAGIVRAGLELPDGGTVNVSAGRRTPGCSGTCPLCSAVISLKAGVVVAAAAGNLPGITYCPARSTISVGAAVSWDADADFDCPPPEWTLRPG